MQESKWRGVFAVLLTPFQDDESVDELALRRHVEWLITVGGVHGIVPNGSTGEFASLSDAERRRVAEVTLETANHRVPVLVGTAANSTAHTIQYSQHAERFGADGVMIVHPYYCQPKEHELYEHYKAVAESIHIPIMIYNNPVTSGVDMKPELLARLAGLPNIRYVKDATGDIKRVGQIRRLCGEAMSVFMGCDNVMFEGFLMGAQGWVSGSANIIPQQCVRLWNLLQAGDYSTARELYYRMLPLGDMFEEEGLFVQYLKAGSAMLGRPLGKPRRPLLPPTEEQCSRLKAALDLIR